MLNLPGVLYGVIIFSDNYHLLHIATAVLRVWATLMW